MRLNLKNRRGENIINIMRQAGYVLINQQEAEFNFVKSIGQYRYPRFHIFLKEKAKNALKINLHLDQKVPLYKNVPAHSADYENNAALTKEAQRIKSFFEVCTKKNFKTKK